MTLTERQAYDAFFERTLTEYHPMISRVVSSYERIPALQEELYQEISMALWKSLSRFDNQSSLKTYILSIAHKRSVSHVAKHVKEPHSVEVEENHLGEDSCPSVAMANRQKMNNLIVALQSFPLIDKQLVTLALEGLSYKEIASILGLSVTNVGAKLNRAKTKLNQLLSCEKKTSTQTKSSLGGRS
jgi:RNA polymerase sigma factor (sigma-70 family)